MMYAPHILLVWRILERGTDEYGRILPPTDGLSGYWEKVGACRCDDNATQDLMTETGRVYRPSYKIVTDRTESVVVGDKIKVTYKNGSTRAEGVVQNLTSTNYLNYTEIYA